MILILSILGTGGGTSSGVAVTLNGQTLTINGQALTITV